MLPHQPPLPHPPPPPQAPQPGPPTLLRRSGAPLPTRPTSPSSVTVASWSSSSASSPRTPHRTSDLDLSKYFAESPPPPPPIHGHLRVRDVSMVPETPESEQRTYAEVLKAARSAPPSPRAPIRQQPLRQRLQSTIDIPARSNYYHLQQSPPFLRSSTQRTPPRGNPVRRRPPVSLPRDEELEPGWTRVRERRRHPASYQPGLHGRTTHSLRPGRTTVSPSLQAFRQKTLGKCFICLHPNHRAATCRAPFRCFRCRRSGHRERECPVSPPPSRARAPSPTRAPPRPPPRPRALPRHSPTTSPLHAPTKQFWAAKSAHNEDLPLPPPVTAGVVRMCVGDPALRPEEESCFVPTSHAIDTDLHKWESREDHRGKDKDKEARDRRGYNNDRQGAGLFRSTRRNDDDAAGYGGHRAVHDGRAHYLSKPVRADHHREWEHSPCRRDRGNGGQHDGGCRRTEVQPTGPNPRLDQHVPLSREPLQLQGLFLQQAAALQDASSALLAAYGNATSPHTSGLLGRLQNYVLKAASLVSQLGMGGGDPARPQGNEASYARRATAARHTVVRSTMAPLVPISGVFQHLREALPGGAVPLVNHGVTVQDVEAALHSMEIRAAEGEPFFGPLPESPIRTNSGSVGQLDSHLVRDARLEDNLTPSREDNTGGIAGLFTTPPPHIVHQQPPIAPQQASATTPLPRRRKRRTFDMSKEYLASFSGPLPAEIIAALTAIFNLDDEQVEEMDFALAAMVGDGVTELQDTGVFAAA
ncbi:unnamed protein product [Urochloa humidicola]